MKVFPHPPGNLHGRVQRRAEEPAVRAAQLRVEPPEQPQRNDRLILALRSRLGFSEVRVTVQPACPCVALRGDGVQLGGDVRPILRRQLLAMLTDRFGVLRHQCREPGGTVPADALNPAAGAGVWGELNPPRPPFVGKVTQIARKSRPALP
ncbi:MAG: hypothetical protein M3478_13655 [Planctomycetota bacterium]|nr:hypothetical protein [Planctomycetota bacterium]